MVAALPVEIVDLILRLSLPQTGTDNRRILSDASSSSPSTSTLRPEPPIDIHAAATVSTLSKHHRDLFQADLYRYVTLLTARSIRLFARTVASRSDLGNKVRSLAILCQDEAELVGGGGGGGTETLADEVLLACSGATHLLLSCQLFGALSKGLYRLRRPVEATLVNVTRVNDFLGIVTRHRDLTAATLQADPRIRAILGSSISATTAAAHDQPSQPSDASSSTSEQPVLAPRAEHSLTHLHLVHFDARLLHRLVTLSSLTHIVLTQPVVPERRPGAPGLSVIPRSHLLLLLGSGNVSHIVVRADLPTCIRMMEEISPVEDGKLVFRPTFSDASQQQVLRSSLPTEVGALYDSLAVEEVDLLGEFWARLRPRSASPSREDADTSRGSGRTSHGRSSDSSGGGTSGSGSTGWGEEDESSQRRSQQDDQSGSDDDPGSDSVEDPPIRNTNAPPLNIPIEELLRSERFTPTGLVGPPHAPSSPRSGTEHTSSASQRQGRRRHSSRTTTPFAIRKTDLRGATQRNIDLCTLLYDALTEEAGAGPETARQSDMGFW
ncbi:uncharacterized protein SPSC_04430 [Sporisorium scitamineum]|uniref:Uncharacterized protein n=1 Tax=Sporisorium scitamineum TaxID=49012 RepID=A0A127Z618_9BASI|nr:uncharacterized protein SPSC_04430 [Sporisorium scitamineum]